MRSWHGCWNTDPETSFSELRPRPGSEAWECLWELGRDLREGMSERERERGNEG